MDLKNTYNLIAEDWTKDHVQDDLWWIEGTEKFATLLHPGSKILDIGCGPGQKSQFLRERGFKVIGIDFSEKFVEIAKKADPKGDYRVMDMYNLGILPNDFNAIFAQAVLLHVPKKDTPIVLARWAAKLVTGGILYIAVKQTREQSPDEETKRENDYGYTYERFFSYYTMSEIENTLKSLGLSVIWQDSKKWNHTTWLQIIGQK